ncbi:MAG: hypothetical protein JSS09_09910 [Verrucomicrobia bacterium]|nr:hypothetical protein [Verrucomicrobiota bacterium]
MINSIRGNIGALCKTYIPPSLKKQFSYSFFQTRFTASSTSYLLTPKNVKSQKSSNPSLQILYPLLALSLYGLQDKTECAESSPNDSISAPQKISTSFSSNSISFKEPTVEELIIEAKNFCESRKTGKIDPKNTHIPFLANVIQCNFITLFPEEKIGDYDLETKLDIENFRKEMKERIEKKDITYEWWLYFNLRLSILATPSLYRSNIKNEHSLDLIKSGDWKNHENSVASNFFSAYDNPSYFLFPTTMGNLSIHTMNETCGTNLWLIGLINKPLIADGKVMWPNHFFYHDLNHLAVQILLLKTFEISLNQMLHTKEKFIQIREILKSFNDPKIIPLIKLLDLVFFHLWHESLNGIPQISNKKLSPITEGLDSNISKSVLLRSDIFLDHYPQPEKFNLSSFWGLHNLGISILDFLLNSSTLPSEDSFQNDIENRIKMFSKDQKKDNDFAEFHLDSNTTILSLNKKQLDFYNEIVRTINTKNIHLYKGLLAKIEKAGSELKTVIKSQKIDQVFEYELSLSSNKTPKSWFNFFDKT